MPNPEHLKILAQGAGAWNQWRAENPKSLIDFAHADLAGAKLNGANLSHVSCVHANFSSAEINHADLRGANLSHARLDWARLYQANLSDALLCEASLTYAHLIGAKFSSANLALADFSNADLSGAFLSGANLHQANFRKTIVGFTTFGSVDMSRVKELGAVRHGAPSTIGIDTLYESGGRVPDSFLRDAGTPEDVIQHLLPLIRNGLPIRWHSCFISYSTKDEDFARRLHFRMREANMRVWFAPEDLKGGKNLHEQVFEAIQIHDRLLLVLSEHSIKSEWVMTEIRKAREGEKRENRRKLFPVRLVDFDTLRNWTCFDADSGKDLAVEVREYFIPDFSNWKDHDAFEMAFARLQQDLKTETQPRSA
jgi:hypothetical protein